LAKVIFSVPFFIQNFQATLDNNIFMEQLGNTTIRLNDAISHTNNVLQTNQQEMPQYIHQYETPDADSNTVVFYEPQHTQQNTTETVQSWPPESTYSGPIEIVVSSQKKVKKYRNPFSLLRINPFAVSNNNVPPSPGVVNNVLSPPPSVVNNVPLLQTPKQSAHNRSIVVEPEEVVRVYEWGEMFGMNDFLDGKFDINSLPIDGFSNIPEPDIELLNTPKKKIKLEIDDEGVLIIDEEYIAKDQSEVVVPEEWVAPIEDSIDVEPVSNEPPPPPPTVDDEKVIKQEEQLISNEEKMTPNGGNEPITTVVVEEVASETAAPLMAVPSEEIQKLKAQTEDDSQNDVSKKSMMADHADSDLDYDDDCLSICASQM
jgi:hypothetical protein